MSKNEMPANFAVIYNQTVGIQEWAKERFPGGPKDFWDNLSGSEQTEYMQQKDGHEDKDEHRRRWLNDKSTEMILNAAGGVRENAKKTVNSEEEEVPGGEGSEGTLHRLLFPKGLQVKDTGGAKSNEATQVQKLGARTSSEAGIEGTGANHVKRLSQDKKPPTPVTQEDLDWIDAEVKRRQGLTKAERNKEDAAKRAKYQAENPGKGNQRKRG